jgi:hypothetical protein
MSIEKPALLPALDQMQPGDHYCGIFRSDVEHRRIVIEFVRLGIERNEKMLYFVNLMTAVQLKSTLSAAGIDVDALVEKGQLVILTAKQAYLQHGTFDPEKMIDMLSQETARTLEAGYSALLVTGEMTWALAGDPGSERLVEYEAMLNRFYATRPRCYAICQYDQRRFDAGLLIDVLQTHPKVLIGTRGFDNSAMYFVPPDAFLTPARHDVILDTWLCNLTSGPRA